LAHAAALAPFAQVISDRPDRYHGATIAQLLPHIPLPGR
jgi:hypothetical protein